MIMDVQFEEQNSEMNMEFEQFQTVGVGVDFTTDETLSFVNGVLSVNTAHEPDPDNTLPITSAAVATTVGNIAALLKTI